MRWTLHVIAAVLAFAGCVRSMPRSEAPTCTLRGQVAFTSADQKPLPIAHRVVVTLGTLVLPSKHPVTHPLEFSGSALTPAVLVVQRGDSIAIHDIGGGAHSPYIDPLDFERPPSKQVITDEGRLTETGPLRVLCENHDTERADVLVLSTPHYTFAADDGSWQLQNIPAAPMTISAWEPNGGTDSVNLDRCTETPTLRVEQKPPVKQRPTFKRDAVDE